MLGIKSCVSVHLGDDPDSPVPPGVHLPCQLESVRVSDVLVSWSDGQDDGVLLGDVAVQHLLDLLLDVLRLVPHRHPGQAGQVHQGQVQNTGRVNP